MGRRSLSGGGTTANLVVRANDEDRERVRLLRERWGLASDAEAIRRALAHAERGTRRLRPAEPARRSPPTGSADLERLDAALEVLADELDVRGSGQDG
jgi:hypothetical protein